jgi:DNA-binding CsgD family transcriptional regulator
MRTISASVALEASPEVAENGDVVMRALTGLIEVANRGRGIGSSESRAEEVLVDTEVDGARYLLVRMRRIERSPIRLSPREQEIVRMVAKGHPNKVIADVLNISSWTVCTHLRLIFAKLGVGSRAAMVAQLADLGIVPSEPRFPSALR